jgi:hypothetical protein
MRGSDWAGSLLDRFTLKSGNPPTETGSPRRSIREYLDQSGSSRNPSETWLEPDAAAPVVPYAVSHKPQQAGDASLRLPGQRRPVRYSDHVQGQGPKFLAHACKLNLEGIISKLGTSPYRSGRTDAWRKVKCLNRQEFVIGGWMKSEKRGPALRTLLLGCYDRGKLIRRERGHPLRPEHRPQPGRPVTQARACVPPFTAVPWGRRNGSRWAEPRGGGGSLYHPDGGSPAAPFELRTAARGPAGEGCQTGAAEGKGVMLWGTGSVGPVRRRVRQRPVMRQHTTRLRQSIQPPQAGHFMKWSLSAVTIGSPQTGSS